MTEIRRKYGETTVYDVSEKCGWGELIVPNPSTVSQAREGALRVVLFGSAVRGHTVLNHLIRMNKEHPDLMNVTGICTDDVLGGRISSGKRLYQYLSEDHPLFLEGFMRATAEGANIPMFTGSVKAAHFQNQILKEWNPDLIIMATFGQLVPPQVFNRPQFGMYNLHPSDLSQGKHPGPDPFKSIMDADEPTTRMSLHHVDGDFDTGAVVGVSPPIRLTKADGSYPHNLTMHECTSSAAARMATALVRLIAKHRKSIDEIDSESLFTNREKEALMRSVTSPCDFNPSLRGELPLYYSGSPALF